MSERDNVIGSQHQIDDYTFLKDAYYGTGGFKDGRYLIMHPRETPEKYLLRQRLAYYLNYMAPVVNSHVDPIFRVEPSREWGNSTYFSNFVNDVDMLGNSINRFMKRAALLAKLYAVVFIVVDNVADQPSTVADAIANRAFPYVYTVKPSQVISYKTDKVGRLTSFCYKTVAETTNSGQTYDTWTWTTTTWEVNQADGTLDKGNHSLGRLPVIPLFSKPMDAGVMLPQSEFYSAAKTNTRIYNLCSEIDELIRSQAFSVLTYPQSEGQNHDNLTEIIVGTENVLGYDGSLSNQPAYIAPSSAPLEQLRAERADLIQEIYRMSVLECVTGVQDQKSGLAKQWDFEQTNQVLGDFAKNCEGADTEIGELFGLWAGQAINYTAKYSDDFGIIDVIDALNAVTAALDLQIGGKFNTEVKKKAATVYLNDLPEDRYDAVMADIDSMEEDNMQANVDLLTGTQNA